MGDRFAPESAGEPQHGCGCSFHIESNGPLSQPLRISPNTAVARPRTLRRGDGFPRTMCLRGGRGPSRRLNAGVGRRLGPGRSTAWRLAHNRGRLLDPAPWDPLAGQRQQRFRRWAGYILARAIHRNTDAHLGDAQTSQELCRKGRYRGGVAEPDDLGFSHLRGRLNVQPSVRMWFWGLSLNPAACRSLQGRLIAGPLTITRFALYELRPTN